MRRFKTIILGSGCFSVGYAVSSENTLIVERTYLTDPCHAATLTGYSFSNNSIMRAQTRELCDRCIDAGIVRDEKLDSPLLEIVLSAYAKEKKIAILFGTECTRVDKCDGGYEVTLFGNSGFETVFASNIIDQRCGQGDTIYVLCRGDRAYAETLRTSFADVTVSDAFHDGEITVGFKLSEDENINALKARILRYFEGIAPCDLKLVELAYAKASSTDEYQDAFLAFESGIRYAEEVLK